MKPIERSTFNKWAQDSKWMQVGEADTVNGRQYSFITPAGTIIIAMFDLKGNLLGFGHPIPAGQPMPAREPHFGEVPPNMRRS